MMEQFRVKWMQLQDNFQWYFQKIDGVSDMLAIDPKQGIRITQDKRLTISMLEGVDLRVSHLMNLYRKIAWDDTYQRWVLPDMMRYFTLKIYVSEFRTFHLPNTTTAIGSQNSELANEEGQLLLHVLDNWLPTWVIKCEMCEFDLESLDFSSLGSLSLNEDPAEAAVQIKIKVGKIYEEQSYPMFENMYLIDKALNGFDRSKASESVTSQQFNRFTQEYELRTRETTFNSTQRKFNNNDTKYRSALHIAQDLPDIQNDVNTDGIHISGTPFNQGLNDKKVIPTQIVGEGLAEEEEASIDSKKKPWLNFNDGKVRIGENVSRDGWVGNAVKFGESFAANAANKVIDFAKVTPVPGLGLSFSEVSAALKAKDIISALGLVKKSVDQIVNEGYAPSELLQSKPETDIAGTMFRNILEELSTSDATDDDSNKVDNLLRAAATTALVDEEVFNGIIDWSRATDLVGQGETNVPNNIDGALDYALSQLQSTQLDNSYATDLVGPGEANIPKSIEGPSLIIEGVPSSQATSSQILKG